jgi:hypothetical protein
VNLSVYAEFFYCSGSSGDILYAKLLKEEILQCDKELLKAAKKAGSIGGKTGSVICDPEVLLRSRKYASQPEVSEVSRKSNERAKG